MAAPSPWWQTANIYQVYVRSFQDGNGDGIGDLIGARSRLDILEDLGIQAIWLSPVHPSPNHDFGYDVADYDSVDETMGGDAALDEFIQDAHARGIKVLLDGVFNHTSSAHPWFQREIDGPQCAAPTWYHWHAGESPPNNWASTFGGPAWTAIPETQRWYLHSFAPEQPDLNWSNPAVCAEVVAIVDRWLSKGIDGFRLDVFNNYAKAPGLPDNPWRTDLLGRMARYVYPFIAQVHQHDRDQAALTDILRALRACADGYDGRVLIGETLDERFQYDNAAQWCGPDRLHLAFHFAWLHSRWGASHFAHAIQRQHAAFSGSGPAIWVLGNHDFPRVAHRWRAGTYTDRRMRLVPLLQLSLPGPVVVYQGDELGTPEVSVPRRQIQDPPGKRFWPLYRGRDGCRSPMAWNNSQHAGFSTTTPWLPLHADASQRNVAAQRQDPHSIWNTYRGMLRLRRSHKTLRDGALSLMESVHPDVFGQERTLPGAPTVRLWANLGTKPVTIECPSPTPAVQALMEVGVVRWQGTTLTLGGLSGTLIQLDQSVN